MANAQSKPSREQAENFHVLPKRDAQAQKEQPKPTLVQAEPGDNTRDPEAGSITGAGTSADVNQPENNSRFDRSQVS